MVTSNLHQRVAREKPLGRALVHELYRLGANLGNGHSEFPVPHQPREYSDTGALGSQCGGTTATQVAISWRSLELTNTARG